jgi:hypothetical protein
VSRRLAILTLVALVLVPVAHAATSGPVFGIRAGGNPKLGYFVYNARPSTVRNGSIIVSNTGNRAGTVKLYTADATTGRTTGTVYLTDKKAKATGAWVKLSSSSLTLAPPHRDGAVPAFRRGWEGTADRRRDGQAAQGPGQLQATSGSRFAA